MRNTDYSHEGMKLTLQQRLRELDNIRAAFAVRVEQMSNPIHPYFPQTQDELESYLSSIAAAAEDWAVRLDKLRDYTLYPPNRRPNLPPLVTSPYATADRPRTRTETEKS